MSVHLCIYCYIHPSIFVYINAYVCVYVIYLEVIACLRSDREGGQRTWKTKLRLHKTSAMLKNMFLLSLKMKSSVQWIILWSLHSWTLSGGDEPSCCDNGLSQHGVWGCVLVCVRTGVCAYRNGLLQCSVTTPVCCDTSHGASSRKVLKMSRRFVSSGSRALGSHRRTIWWIWNDDSVCVCVC